MNSEKITVIHSECSKPIVTIVIKNGMEANCKVMQTYQWDWPICYHMLIYHLESKKKMKGLQKLHEVVKIPRNIKRPMDIQLIIEVKTFTSLPQQNQKYLAGLIIPSHFFGSSKITY